MEGSSSSNNSKLESPECTSTGILENNPECSRTTTQNVMEPETTCISPSSTRAESQMLSSSESEPETSETSKWFEIQPGAHYRERMLARRFSPYPVHQQLFMQQQLEQERRRLSLSRPASSRYPYSRHYDYRSRHVHAIFSDKCRTASPHKLIAFVDTLSIRLTSTQNDCAEKCVICMSHYNTDEQLRELKCTHKFHRTCIDAWLVKSFLCPVCRTDLSGSGNAFHMWKEFLSTDNSNVDLDPSMIQIRPVFERPVNAFQLSDAAQEEICDNIKFTTFFRRNHDN